MLYRTFLFFMYLWSSIFVKHIRGLDNIPKNGCIVASNHTSFIDPPIIDSFIYAHLKIKIHFLAKKQLFESLPGKILHSSVESIPIDPTGKDKSWLKRAIQYLKKGHIIGIFPEGGRSSTRELQRGKTGVVRLALLTKVPIVPIGIEGSFDVWPRDKKMFNLKKIVNVNIGKPIYLDKYYNRKITKKQLRKITEDLMKEIAKLMGQKYNP
jgi:1-acyl-sn-glycerol-3-phosphate acyltransferase